MKPLLGTPGPELLDILEWRQYLDFALACEKDSTDLRALKFYARTRFPEGYVQATSATIEDVLADAESRWPQLFDSVPSWPCIVNYDVYANPALPGWRAFRREGGLWRGVKTYLHAVQDEMPLVLLLVTANLRGRTKDYDSALDAVFGEIRKFGIDVDPQVAGAFFAGRMSKKCQICIPYWLSRFAATPEGFKVDIVESLEYPGTKAARVIHLLLKLRHVEDAARAEQITTRELVNFPHQIIEQDAKGNFVRISTDFPAIGPKLPPLITL